jgi:hypothetical protein
MIIYFYDLFNDGISSSERSPLKDRFINERKIGKDVEESGLSLFDGTIPTFV